jgi:hypothetical protein
VGLGALRYLHKLNWKKRREKLLARERHPCLLSGVCGTSWRLNTIFWDGVWCVFSSLSQWWGVCSHPLRGGAPMIFFLSLLFSLSSTLENLLPLQKIRNVCYLLILLYLVLIILIISDLISLFFNFIIWFLYQICPLFL